MAVTRKSIRIISVLLALVLSVSLMLTGCGCGPVNPDTNETAAPTAEPTSMPSEEPAFMPTDVPTSLPTDVPTSLPTDVPTSLPTDEPASVPTDDPDAHATEKPTAEAENLRVYLTFDDGPCNNTGTILQILEDYGIKASFFTVGYFIDRHPDMIVDMLNAGHLVCCHTYSHEMKQIYASAEAFMQDIDQWVDAFIRAAGSEPPCRILRFPGGSNNPYIPKALRLDCKQEVTADGWRYFDWTFGDNDRWPAGNVDNLPEKEYLLSSFRSTLRMAISAGKPLIFLAHETSDESVELLPLMLDEMIEMGCTFGTIDELESSYGF